MTSIGFRTDTDISSRPNPSSFQPGRERVLEPWHPSPSDPSSSGLVSDADTFGDTSLPTGPSNGKGGAGGWDQFAENEKRFGTRTDFDEELYTTKLDRSGKDFRERERRAELLAGQIMGQSSANPHIQEERGQKLEDSGLGEEDRSVTSNLEDYSPSHASVAHSYPLFSYLDTLA
jgi:PAB1-binding protein PBP1